MELYSKPKPKSLTPLTLNQPTTNPQPSHNQPTTNQHLCNFIQEFIIEYRIMHKVSEKAF